MRSSWSIRMRGGLSSMKSQPMIPGMSIWWQRMKLFTRFQRLHLCLEFFDRIQHGPDDGVIVEH